LLVPTSAWATWPRLVGHVRPCIVSTIIILFDAANGCAKLLIMSQVRHISPFAFWLANPFQYPTPQRDIVYQNLLKINVYRTRCGQYPAIRAALDYLLLLVLIITLSHCVLPSQNGTCPAWHD